MAIDKHYHYLSIFGRPMYEGIPKCVRKTCLDSIYSTLHQSIYLSRQLELSTGVITYYVHIIALGCFLKPT